MIGIELHIRDDEGRKEFFHLQQRPLDFLLSFDIQANSYVQSFQGEQQLDLLDVLPLINSLFAQLPQASRSAVALGACCFQLQVDRGGERLCYQWWGDGGAAYYPLSKFSEQIRGFAETARLDQINLAW